MTASISPTPNPNPQIRYQPSMLSVPSSASTVKPEELGPPSAERPKRGARRKLWFFTTLAVVAGALTAGALSSPDVSSQVHSGSPGFRKAKNGQSLHWRQQALSVYLDDSLAKIGPQADDAVMQAFGRWVESDERLPNLSFDRGNTSAIPTHDGKSTISYGRITAPGHERDLAITVTYAEDTGEIVEADIVLNSMYPIGVLTERAGAQGKDSELRDSGSSKGSNEGETDDCQNRYDVQNVTTHEVGHFFGLGEDLVEREAAMFQTIDQCETHKRALSATDVGALSSLYAESEDPEEVAAGPRACSLVATPETGPLGLICTLIVGLAAVLRRRSTRC